MKVSVLVPVYNGEGHLSECLESILRQKFDDMEILISDNGSTDGTVKIIEDYAVRDHRIRWWQNSRNHGMTGNHNVCLREARGEYLKFVHADDRLLSPLTLPKMVAALEAHPAAVLAGSRQHLTGTKAIPFRLAKTSGFYGGKQLIIHGLERNTNPVGPPSLTLVRRSAAGRGFDERFTSHMDIEMWCHLLEQGDFVYLAETLATWRVHEHHQTAIARSSGMKDHDHLRFMETYYAKPWLREMATPRLLFTQIYYLQKEYGSEARPLTSLMMAQLTSPAYRWQWLKHKTRAPVHKFSARISRLLSRPRHPPHRGGEPQT